MADVAAQLSDLEWPVRTSRLLLRPAEERAEDAIWSYRRDEETARWLSSWPVDRSAFHPSTEQPAEWAGMIVIELDGAVIGNVLVRLEMALGLRPARGLGHGGTEYGSTVASRAVVVFEHQATGVVVIAERHAGSAGPPSKVETMRLRDALDRSEV